MKQSASNFASRLVIWLSVDQEKLICIPIQIKLYKQDENIVNFKE